MPGEILRLQDLHEIVSHTEFVNLIYEAADETVANESVACFSVIRDDENKFLLSELATRHDDGQCFNNAALFPSYVPMIASLSHRGLDNTLWAQTYLFVHTHPYRHIPTPSDITYCEAIWQHHNPSLMAGILAVNAASQASSLQLYWPHPDRALNPQYLQMISAYSSEREVVDTMRSAGVTSATLAMTNQGEIEPSSLANLENLYKS